MNTKIRLYKSWLTPIAALAALALTMACNAEEPGAQGAASKSYDLYLLIGQSNMAGRGQVDKESKLKHPRVFTLTRDGQWGPAVDPLHFDKPSAGVGPGLTFGKAMADACPKATIGLIPCAVGGTSISSWVPGIQDRSTKAFPYDDMLKRAQRACKDGTLKGIIWHQGESDRKPPAISLYTTQLTELVARLRKDLNAPDLPFIAGELGQLDEANREANTIFNTQLRGLTSTVKNYACVTAEGLTDKGDRLHFNTESARTLGARYAVAMLGLIAPDGVGPGKTNSK